MVSLPADIGVCPVHFITEPYVEDVNDDDLLCAAHWPQIEAPELTLQHFDAFIKSVSSTPTAAATTSAPQAAV